MRNRALGLVLLLFAGACGGGEREVALMRAPDVVAPAIDAAAASDPEAFRATSPSTTAATTTTTAAPAPATTEVTVAKAAPPPTTAPPVAASTAWTIEPYRGFGAWLDAYDWSQEFTGSANVVGPEAVDHMAAEGVETLYIQASRWNSANDVLDADRLKAIIDRAHHHDIDVVAWYLPTFEDVAFDLRRILAIAALDIEGLAIDIEARDVADVAERNRRLISLSQQLRTALPGRFIGGIVLEPVLMEDVNPNYWPGFPWAEIAPYYDVWLPMSYWTNRRGHWRSAYHYTAENIVRIRERVGDPNAPVHTIGGIGDKTTVPDLEQMVHASMEHKVIGGSLYDYRTSRPEFWATLRYFRG